MAAGDLRQIDSALYPGGVRDSRRRSWQARLGRRCVPVYNLAGLAFGQPSYGSERVEHNVYS